MCSRSPVLPIPRPALAPPPPMARRAPGLALAALMGVTNEVAGSVAAPRLTPDAPKMEARPLQRISVIEADVALGALSVERRCSSSCLDLSAMMIFEVANTLAYFAALMLVNGAGRFFFSSLQPNVQRSSARPSRASSSGPTSSSFRPSSSL